jgi:hypothetical protein
MTIRSHFSKSTLARTFIALSAMALSWGVSGCSTTDTTQDELSWNALLSSKAANVNGPHITYDQAQVTRDLKQLQQLQQSLESLHQEIATIQRTLAFQDLPYLDDATNKEIQFFLFRFITARDALSHLVETYRSTYGIDEQTQTQGALIAMASGLTSDYYSAYFCALFYGNKAQIEILNTAHPRFDIPENTYNSIYDSVTSLDNIELIRVAWHLYAQERNTPESSINQVIATAPAYAQLAQQMDSLHAGTQIQTEYLLHSARHTLEDLENRMRHSKIAALAKSTEQTLSGDLYKTRGFLFKNVARIKEPDTHLLQFSPQQANEIKQLLQPGDIILTYTAGYMSDVFLPGNFKHGITYIGTPEQRRAAGLTDEALRQAAVSEEQAATLIENVQVSEMPDGNYRIDIIEAVAEGVVLHSLDKLLATHINRLVVIRPKLSEAERQSQLIEVFQYVNTSYDFKFDFQNDRYQCCTELVYRTTDGKGNIDYSLVHMKGRWILAADDILRYYLSQNPEGFEFVLLADQSADTTDYKADLQTGPEGLKALYKLMDLPEPSPATSVPSKL